MAFCSTSATDGRRTYLAAGRIDDGVHQQNDLLLVGAELRSAQAAGRHVHGHNVAGRHHCVAARSLHWSFGFGLRRSLRDRVRMWRLRTAARVA